MPPTLSFAVVGEPKSGTTALAEFLAQHPQVSVSVPKETAFFSTDFHRASDEFHGRRLYFSYRSEKDFEGMFRHAGKTDLLGDCSTSYMYSAEAAANLHAHNPNLKIVAMLRNPVDMVHSLHMQYVNETVEDIASFEEALAAEDDRKAGRRVPDRVRAPAYLFYSERIKYADHVRKFQDLFGAENVLVLINEEFRADNAGGFARVLRHIGADDSFVPEFAEVHGSKTARSAAVNRALNNARLKRVLRVMAGGPLYTRIRDAVARVVMKPAARQGLDPELRARLYERFRPEIDDISSVLGRDLTEVWTS